MHNNEQAVDTFQSPTVAVFMAVYEHDCEEWADAALASILTQSYPQKNIHVYLGVDGPLPARMERWVDHISSKVHRVVRHTQRLGLAAMLNDLLKALGDESFIFRMDSDDLSLEGRFQSQIDYMSTHPEVGILGTGIEEVDEQLNHLSTRFYSTADQVRYTIAKVSPLAHPTVCFRASVLRQLGGYPLSGFNEDIALWFKAVVNGVVIDNLPEVHLRYRLGAGTFKRRGWRKAFGEFSVYVRGIWALHGLSGLYVFPLLRLGLRLLPPAISRLAYGNVEARNSFSGQGKRSTTEP